MSSKIIFCSSDSISGLSNEGVTTVAQENVTRYTTMEHQCKYGIQSGSHRHQYRVCFPPIDIKHRRYVLSNWHQQSRFYFILLTPMMWALFYTTDTNNIGFFFSLMQEYGLNLSHWHHIGVTRVLFRTNMSMCWKGDNRIKMSMCWVSNICTEMGA